MAHSALFVGIDVAKQSLEVATWPSSEQRRFANDEVGLEELARYLRQLHPQAVGECQDFRVWAGIMGKKETQYVATQRACDTERASRPVAGRWCRECGI